MLSMKSLGLMLLSLSFSHGVLCQESGAGLGPIDFSGVPGGGAETPSQAVSEKQLLADSVCQTQLFDPSVIFHFDTIYNWACGGSWDGAPVDSTNGPTDHQLQLALDLSFFDKSDSGSVYVELHNLITGNAIWTTGSCYNGFTLTGVMVQAPGVLSVDLNRARPGQEVCYGDCSNPEPLCQLEGWYAAVDDTGFSMSTSGCPNFGLVSFGSISNSTRIRNGFLVELEVDDSFTMDSLTVEVQFGCGQQTIVPIDYSSWGCTDIIACNFDAGVTIEDGSCLYPSCDEPSACNYDPQAVCGGGECVPSGCRESDACNFDPEAQCDGEECDYSCCPGPGCCDVGMHWDWELGMCQITNVADTNLDGCVQLNDLLDLLSAYGNCAVEESAWQCGDPLDYQGYDYETVQIGEQCWFAENLRSENYRNGDTIPENLSDIEWGNTTSGAVAVIGEGTSDCNAYSPDGDACDEFWSLNEYGRLYNWFAVDDTRGLCPSGWHVSSDDEWMTMEMVLGMSEAQVNESGWRGTDQGAQLKSVYGWSDGGNGTNSSSFSGLPGGLRASNGMYNYAGGFGYWWSSQPGGSPACNRYVSYASDNVYRYYESNLSYGFSVRCIQDSE